MRRKLSKQRVGFGFRIMLRRQNQSSFKAVWRFRLQNHAAIEAAYREDTDTTHRDGLWRGQQGCSLSMHMCRENRMCMCIDCGEDSRDAFCASRTCACASIMARTAGMQPVVRTRCRRVTRRKTRQQDAHLKTRQQDVQGFWREDKAQNKTTRCAAQDTMRGTF